MREHVLVGAWALAFVPAATAQAPQPATDEPAALARSALERGAQRELVQAARRWLAQAPDEPLALLVSAAAHASLGPEFAKDLALQGLRRLLAVPLEQLPKPTRELLAEWAGLRGAAGKLRSELTSWLQAVQRGDPLLVAADKATLTRTAAAADRDVAQLQEQQSRARGKLAEARKAIARAERALESARTRKFAVGEGMRDLQPLADTLHAARQTAAAQERRLRELDQRLPRAKQRAAQLRARLGQFRG